MGKSIVVEEVEGMVFKEEDILLSCHVEKLKTADWIDILKESDEIGYAFIEKPKETSTIIEELKKTLLQRRK